MVFTSETQPCTGRACHCPCVLLDNLVAFGHLHPYAFSSHSVDNYYHQEKGCTHPSPALQQPRTYTQVLLLARTCSLLLLLHFQSLGALWTSMTHSSAPASVNKYNTNRASNFSCFTGSHLTLWTGDVTALTLLQL